MCLTEATLREPPAQLLEEESGLEKAVLWFRTELTEWQSLNMTYENGNWTCTIPGQKNETTVIFYVECCDKSWKQRFD